MISMCGLCLSYKCRCDKPEAPAPVCPATLDIFAHPKQAPAQPVKTSQDAAARVSPKLSQKRRDLLLYLCAHHANKGATDNQLIRELTEFGWSPNGVRPRRVELVRGDWLDEAGESNGSTLWVPSAKAMAWYEARQKVAA